MARLTVSIKLSQLAKMARSINQLTERIEAMSEDVQRLRDEVAAENTEDVLTAQTISTLTAKITELQAQIDATQPLIDAAKAGEANALAELEDVLTGVREAVADLAQDNPPADGIPVGA